MQRMFPIARVSFLFAASLQLSFRGSSDVSHDQLAGYRGISLRTAGIRLSTAFLTSLASSLQLLPLASLTVIDSRVQGHTATDCLARSTVSRRNVGKLVI